MRLTGSIRLLPVVVLAAGALLGLKTVGLLTGNGYSLSALAQEEWTEAQNAAADAAAQALVRSAPGAGQAGVSHPAEASERAVLERLAERREALDAFAAELEERLAVVEAAEIRIRERQAELAALEARVDALVEGQEARENAQFAGLVAMYESMRPADAAAIFDRLDMDILSRVGQAMNPRRLGPVLAKMRPERAEALTVALARRDAGLAPVPVADLGADLPQIVGH